MRQGARPRLAASSISQVTSLLALSANRRYFVDQFGQPVLLFGDAAWELSQNLTFAEGKLYLDDRKARGVNLLLVDPVGKFWATNSPNNIENVAPFTGTTAGEEDLSTPNERFWARHDWFVNEAALRGQYLLHTPSYVGNTNQEGYYLEFEANSQAKVEAYADFLTNRYRGYPHIIPLVSGDRAWSALSATVQTRLEQFAARLKLGDPRRLQSAHFLNSDLNWEHPSGQWLDWHFVYTTAGVCVTDILASYNYSGTAPVIMGETTYVDGTFDGPVPSRKKLRGIYWQAMTSGAVGFVPGNENVWPFGGPNGYAGTDWQGNLGGAYMDDAQRLYDFLRVKKWWLLEPDQSSTLVTAGRGAQNASYVTAAKASDNSFAVIYDPPGTSITVNFATMGGSCRVDWFDPSNGALTNAGTGLTGSQSIDPPVNAAGDTDMVGLIRRE